MGLIDFVRGAGEKLFGASEAAAAPADDEATRSKRSEALENAVKQHGLEVDRLKVKVAGDLAAVRGSVATQAIREKVVLVLGNVAGIARVDDGLEVASPEPEATYHTVERGDTLWKIAKEHYGNGNEYPEIFEANRPMLKDPDKIYPGQVLRIPPKA